MLEKRDPYPIKDVEYEKYRSCVTCGMDFIRYELQFDAGSVAPTVGETITGATCTGVVTASALESGSYAAGTAVGTLELSGVTGAADDLAFVDNENLVGSSTFRGVANTKAIGKHYGLFYPESRLGERDGKMYCPTHFSWRWAQKDRDDSKLDIEESSD
jgi:hypothetical protein